MAGRARGSRRVLVTLPPGIKGANAGRRWHMNSPTASCDSVSSEVTQPLPHTRARLRAVTTPPRRPSKLIIKDGASLTLVQSPFASSSSVPAKECKSFPPGPELHYLPIARECGVVDPHGYERGRRDPRGTLVFAETVCVFEQCFASPPWSATTSSTTKTWSVVE